MTDFFAELEQQIHGAARRQVRYGRLASVPRPAPGTLVAATALAACVALAIAFVPSLVRSLGTEPERPAVAPVVLDCGAPRSPELLREQFGVFRRERTAEDRLPREHDRTLAKVLAEGEYPFYAAKLWTGESRLARRTTDATYWLVPALLSAPCEDVDALEPGVCMTYENTAVDFEPPYECVSVSEIRRGVNYLSAGLAVDAATQRMEKLIVAVLPDGWHAEMRLPDRTVPATVEGNLAIAEGTIELSEQGEVGFVVAPTKEGLAKAKIDDGSVTSTYGPGVTEPEEEAPSSAAPSCDPPGSTFGRGDPPKALLDAFQVLRERGRDYDGQGALGAGGVAIGGPERAMRLYFHDARQVRATSRYTLIPALLDVSRRCSLPDAVPGLCVAPTDQGELGEGRCIPLEEIESVGMLVSGQPENGAVVVAVVVPDGVTHVELTGMRDGPHRIAVRDNLAEATVREAEAKTVRVSGLSRGR